MKKVLVLIPVGQADKEKLLNAGKDCSFVFSSISGASEQEIREANIIIGNPNAAMIGASENLELLQLESAGADQYIAPGVLNAKTVLTNATGAYSPSVAEQAFAMTLALQKKLYLYRDEQKRAAWVDHGEVAALNGSTVVIVGLGDIGQYYAKLVKAMGAYVIGVKRRASDRPECVDELCLTENLKDVLPRADVVMSVLPGTKATQHIYSEEYFDSMKDSALFINCGRGNAVATDVLYKVLKEKKITAAAVDVTEIEPLPADSKLWGLENLIITPHVCGGYHLPTTLSKIADIAAANLKAYLANEQLRNVVDFATGYKK